MSELVLKLDGSYVLRGRLHVAPELAVFLEQEALPGSGIDAAKFWAGFEALIENFSARNIALLRKRDALQAQIDAWHIGNRGAPHDHDAYKAFLFEIGYLLPEGDDFQIETSDVDPEIAEIAGPQLVVPITNARFAINAANARWGSLYDAFYGTDAMGALSQPEGGYDRGRGARVVTRTRTFLDEAFPIQGASHGDARRYHVRAGALFVDESPLVDPNKFVGFVGEARAPSSIFLRNNGLHVELVFDRAHVIGRRDQACLADVRLESAVSVIMDCEDSVACVDAADKVLAYRNWLGLMTGKLSDHFVKSGQSFTRTLNENRVITAADGRELPLKSRALMMIRNVGHLTRTPAVLDADGQQAFEGLIDALVSCLIALHDRRRRDGDRNSAFGSIYVVKPKMHGPEEVAFANDVFSFVERVLDVPGNTVKIGIMDEERRTSVNLKECIRAARQRVAFINTGFLDRTGDEIHTSMQAGVFSRKSFIKQKSWLAAYEQQNVDIGLACGFAGRAQVGKGMWAQPDRMAAMLESKIEHPRAGGSCAWVPSPTAATLHALHYHRVDVRAVQAGLARGGRRIHVDALLEIPVAKFKKWSPGEIIREVENNAQSILGYVVRWIDHGVGCSKVPDVNDVALMEDRATCRISAQHLANWLEHAVVSAEAVMDALQRMAAVVDRQNAHDPGYLPMTSNFNGAAFQAACELVFEGAQQPSGYTDIILHRRRLAYKRGMAS